MTGSRTGKGEWRRIRAEMLAECVENGWFNCPLCRTPMDFEYSCRPNSPEIDHVVLAAHGGSDDRSNLRVVCRLCNQSRGTGAKRKPVVKRIEADTQVEW